jgi:enoyl-CoA hydratase/carnithine racemase
VGGAICAALAEAAARYREISLRGYDAVRDFSLPTIAVIDGLCIGGGNNLALACDITLASPRAIEGWASGGWVGWHLEPGQPFVT